MPAIGLALTPFRRVGEVEFELHGLAGRGLPGDPRALSFEEALQGLRLAACDPTESGLRLFGSCPRALFEDGPQVGNVLLCAGQQALHHIGGRLGCVPQSTFQCGERRLLTGLAEGFQPATLTRRFAPKGCDRDDLLMQACGSRSIERQTADQDDTCLAARPGNDTGAIETRLESVRDEAREQPTHQAMLEMDLHHALGVAVVF
jgi:hypothetical protein